MNKAPSTSGSDSDANKTEGFKFAIAIIVAFSTIGSKIFDYVRDNPIHPLDAAEGSLLLMPMIVLLLIVYLFVRGVSLEVSIPETKDKLEKVSSSIYIKAFQMGILSLVCFLSFKIFFWFSYRDNNIQIFGYLCVIIYLLVFLVLKILKIKINIKEVLFWILLWKGDKINELNENEKSSLSTFRIFLLITIISTISILSGYGLGPFYIEAFLSILYLASNYFKMDIFLDYYQIGMFESKRQEKNILNEYSDSIYFLTIIIILFAYPYIFGGDIKFTINDIDNTDVTPISLDLVTNGLCYNMTINLTKTDVEGNVAILDSITVYPSDENEVVFGKYLHSSSLEYGKYKVFINSTNLTQGYYELSFSKNILQATDAQSVLGLYNKKNTSTSFYLAKTNP